MKRWTCSLAFLALAACVSPTAGADNSAYRRAVSLQNLTQVRTCFITPPTTLAKEVTTAHFVLSGTPGRVTPATDGSGLLTIDFHIETAIKDWPPLRGKASVPLIWRGTVPQSRHVVFCERTATGNDTYLVLPDPDGEITRYLKSAVALVPDTLAHQLRFYFEFLGSPNVEIARDAYVNFLRADAADLMKLVRLYGTAGMREKLRKWLQAPVSSPDQLSLYGLLLGLFRDLRDAPLFLSALANQDPESMSDGLAAGYVLADRRAGWTRLMKTLVEKDAPFTKRYSALRAVRYLWEQEPSIIGEAGVLEVARVCLAQEDIADLVVEDLRRWQLWQLTDTILELAGQERYQTPLMQRSVLRYALLCPVGSYASTTAYLERKRSTHPQMVRETAELLDLEKSVTETTPRPRE